MLNTESPHATQKPGKKTRQRKIRVCTECRKRKQRCDQGLPCHNCTRRYPPVLCTYADSSKASSSKETRSPETIVALGSDPQRSKGTEAKNAFALRAAEHPAHSSGSASLEVSTSVPLHQSKQAAIAPDRHAALVRRQNASGAAWFRKDNTKLEHLPPEYTVLAGDMSGLLPLDPRSPYYPRQDDSLPSIDLLNIRVGDGAIEPLHHLPIEPSKRNAELLHFFVQRLSAYMSSIDGKNPPEPFMSQWLPFMIHSPFVICITILASSYFQASAVNMDVNKSVDAVAIKVKLISLLNEHITTHSKGVDDEAIAAVMSLAYNELTFADQKGAIEHMKGLREMIRTRGGLSNIKTSLLQMMLMRTDYQVACTFECDPIIQCAPEAPIMNSYPIDLDCPLLLSSYRFVDYIDIHQISTATAIILDDVRFITTSAISLSEVQHPEVAEIKFLATVRWIHQRLTSTEIEPHLANDFMYQTCRTTAIIYSKAILYGQPFSEACTTQLLRDIWSVLWRVPLSRWKQSPGLFSWVVLVIVPFATNRSQGRPLKGLLAANIVAVGVIDWEASAAVLKTFLAVQRWIRNKKSKSASAVESSSQVPVGGHPGPSLA